MPVGLILLFGALAQDASVPQSRLHLVTGEGETLDVRALEWSNGADAMKYVTGSGDSATIAAARVAQVDIIPPRPTAAAAGPWQVFTRTGTRLSGDIAGGDESALHLVHAQLGELQLPLDRLERIQRRGHGTIPNAGQRPQQDEIRLINGDVDRGLIVSLSEQSITLMGDKDERTIAWRVVAAVHFTAAESAVQNAAFATLTLADGDRLMAAGLKLADGVADVHTSDGFEARFPLATLARVELPGGRRIWLSEVPASNTQVTPWFTARWPPMMNRNAMGSTLRIAGQRYEKGLGLHSACRLSWSLDGSFSKMTGLVGIDDSGGPWSDADVTVRVDGAIVAHFPGLRHGAAPRELSVVLTGAKELVIEVGFGRHGDVQDRVNLVNVALHR